MGVQNKIFNRQAMGYKGAVNADIIIGIDPDTHQSGVARLDVLPRKATATHLPFHLLMDYIMDVKEVARLRSQHLVIVVESSWHDSHNWHLNWKDSKAVAAKKGYAVGAMHQVGKLLVEMLEHNRLEVHEVRPLVKSWKGLDRKITHEEMTEICRWDKKRSNQEERDAMLLAWSVSRLPIKVKV
jgi:hypothetical protein